MKRFGLSRVLVVGLGVLAGCSETSESFYAGAASARASGAVAAGWVPEWIPPDAGEIREVHNIDTNESAMAFALPPGTWRTPSSCRPAQGGEFVEPRFDRPWIPSGKDLASKFKFFSCTNASSPQMIEAVAVRFDEAFVLHWRGYAL